MEGLLSIRCKDSIASIRAHWDLQMLCVTLNYYWCRFVKIQQYVECIFVMKHTNWNISAGSVLSIGSVISFSKYFVLVNASRRPLICFGSIFTATTVTIIKTTDVGIYCEQCSRKDRTEKNSLLTASHHASHCLLNFV